MITATARALLDLQALEFPAREGKWRENGTRKLLRLVHRIRSRVASQVLRTYDTRKQRFGSASVVPIQGSFCTGCRVTVSVKTRREADSKLAECEHCGRLLYNPAKWRPLKLEILDAADDRNDLEVDDNY